MPSRVSPLLLSAWSFHHPYRKPSAISHPQGLHPVKLRGGFSDGHRMLPLNDMASYTGLYGQADSTQYTSAANPRGIFREVKVRVDP